MATYCTDEDMAAVRGNIMGLGVSDWETERTEAYDHINKLILVRWYRPTAIGLGLDPDTTPFDPTKVDEDQIKRCATFKSLELAYMTLMKEGEDADGFERFMDKFANEFIKAFDLEMALGLKYDWDDDGETSDEYYKTAPRRLARS
jgi:hypothetical protein